MYTRHVHKRTAKLSTRNERQAQKEAKETTSMLATTKNPES